MFLLNKECFNELVNRMSRQIDSRILLYNKNLIETASWWDTLKAKEEGGEFERHGAVALINCVGPLNYKYDFWAWLFDASCYQGIQNRMNAAASDANIEKIVLYVDSPGGSTHGLPEASDAIHLARQSKEVVAVVDPTGASAAYWLASQCSRIVGLKSGWVGSVGAQIQYISWARALDQEGIDVEVIRSKVSPHKNAAHPLEPIKEDAKQEWQKMTDEIGNQFIEHVARGRGVSIETVQSSFGQGRMLFLPEARDKKMVDGFGSLQEELSQSKEQASSSQSTATTSHDSCDSRLVPLQ